MLVIKKIVLFLFVIAPILVLGQNKKVLTKTFSSSYYNYPYNGTKSFYYNENDSVVLHGKQTGDINYNSDGRICKYHLEEVYKDGVLDGKANETLTFNFREVIEWRGKYFTTTKTESYSATTYYKDGKKVGTWKIKYNRSEYNDYDGNTESSGDFTFIFNNDKIVGYCDGSNDFKIDENGLVTGTLYKKDVGTFSVSKGIVTDKFIRLTGKTSLVSEDDIMAKVVNDVIAGDTSMLKGGHYSLVDASLYPFWRYDNAKFPVFVSKLDINTFEVPIHASFVRKAKLLTLEQAKEQMNIYYTKGWEFPNEGELFNKLTFEEIETNRANNNDEPWFKECQYVNISESDVVPLKRHIDSLKNERAEKIRQKQEEEEERIRQKQLQVHQEQLKRVADAKQYINKKNYKEICYLCDKYTSSASYIYINGYDLEGQYKDSIITYLNNVHNQLRALDSLKDDVKKRRDYYTKSYPKYSFVFGTSGFWTLDSLLDISRHRNIQEFTMAEYDEYKIPLLRQAFLYKNYEQYVFLWGNIKKERIDHIKNIAGKDYKDVANAYSQAINMKRKIFFSSFKEFVQYVQLCQNLLKLTSPCEDFISQRISIDSTNSVLTRVSSQYKHIAKSYKKYYSNYDKSWIPSDKNSNSLDSLAIFQDSCLLFVSLNDEIKNTESQILSEIKTQKLKNVKKAYFKCKDSFSLLDVPPTSSEQLRSFIDFQKVVEKNLSGESSNIIDTNLKKAKNVEEMKSILIQ